MADEMKPETMEQRWLRLYREACGKPGVLPNHDSPMWSFAQLVEREACAEMAAKLAHSEAMRQSLLNGMDNDARIRYAILCDLGHQEALTEAAERLLAERESNLGTKIAHIVYLNDLLTMKDERMAGLEKALYESDSKLRFEAGQVELLKKELMRFCNGLAAKSSRKYTAELQAHIETARQVGLRHGVCYYCQASEGAEHAEFCKSISALTPAPAVKAEEKP